MNPNYNLIFKIGQAAKNAIRFKDSKKNQRAYRYWTKVYFKLCDKANVKTISHLSIF